MTEWLGGKICFDPERADAHHLRAKRARQPAKGRSPTPSLRLSSSERSLAPLLRRRALKVRRASFTRSKDVEGRQTTGGEANRFVVLCPKGQLQIYFLESSFCR